MNNNLSKQDILQYEKIHSIIEEKVYKIFKEQICNTHDNCQLESWNVSSLYGLKIVYSYQGTGAKVTVFKYFNIKYLID